MIAMKINLNKNNCWSCLISNHFEVLIFFVSFLGWFVIYLSLETAQKAEEWSFYCLFIFDSAEY